MQTWGWILDAWDALGLLWKEPNDSQIDRLSGFGGGNFMEGRYESDY